MSTSTTGQPVPCHPNPAVRGNAPNCPYTEPCTRRCHALRLDHDGQLVTHITRYADHPRGNPDRDD
ncbi:hypothetical protein [Krasilnikovia sp. M28-CT-15]|uniref:hypothetical protein n=1 Tax=Krasilnikovia sp. M28-CT-15 TaxID=3373540 RepID=UPI003876CA77